MELLPHAAAALQENRSKEARELLEEAVAAFRAPEAAQPDVPDRLLLQALVMRSFGEIQEGCPREALDTLSEALALNDEHAEMCPGDDENTVERANILFHVAFVHEQLGDAEQARALAHQSLSLASHLGDVGYPLRQYLEELLARLPAEE